MKKSIVAVALIAGMALTTPVFAHWSHGNGWGGGNGNSQQFVQQDPAARQKVSQFLKDNQELTKQIAMKRAEKMALMRADNPDSKAVANVVGEIFDLRATLMTKADEAGVAELMGPGMGLGMMGGKGMGRLGMGPGMRMGGRGGQSQNCPMW
mgnify:CR=1 FL=1